MAWTTPGTATAGEVLTAAFWNTQVRDNLNMIAPFMSAGQSWTPTMSNSWANGNATASGKYFQVGKLVIFWAQIILGSTTTKGASSLKLSLPVTASDVYTFSGLQFSFEDSGSNLFFGTGTDYASATTSTIVAQVASVSGTYASLGFVTSTTPFTWTTGDKIYYSGTYEAA
jgi:hypothetical protein